jgi:hypothetical protein
MSRAGAFAVLVAIGVSVTPARAVDGTWMGPGAEWTTGTNWSSTPTVPDNTATFTNNGAPTSVTISANGFPINTIQFTAAAPAFTFTIAPGVNFIINGAGIVNNSPNSQSFGNDGFLTFGNGTAGNATITNNVTGTLEFLSTSTPATPPSPTTAAWQPAWVSSAAVGPATRTSRTTVPLASTT